MNPNRSSRMNRQQKILVVDDEKHIVDFYARLLETRDLSCTCVRSGREALTALSRDAFSLVISDMMMPEMNGQELLERIAAEHGNTRRILISGSLGNEAQVAKFNDMGLAHRILAKPCSIDTFFEAVESELDQVSQLAG